MLLAMTPLPFLTNLLQEAFILSKSLNFMLFLLKILVDILSFFFFISAGL